MAKQDTPFADVLETSVLDPLPHPSPVPLRTERYQEVLASIRGLLDGETDPTLMMATVACELHHAFASYDWTGFYRVVDGGLVIGPYQGTVGCLRIDFGRGVCGTAAQTGETQVVPDVHEFPGHIACDPNSQSEIVVPVRDPSGELIAVLDIDSERLGWFDEEDRIQLEKILGEVFG